ncbi:MAG: lycopene cyclase family protein [Gammaproteobacteria bacterium]|jgi:lycopene beta-cyclase|nr:lycopene cyclase family protein [Gammaproteobacteria bacterium]
MSIRNKYDFIIIGAGCAGLSLAYKLINSKYKICILELSNNINKRNKLWSFWDTYETPFSHLIKKKWNNLIIRNEDESIKINCNRYKYQSISSKDFNNYILEKINISENIDIFFSEEVVNISKKTNLIELTTKQSTYLCDHIFDSRPSKNNFFMMQQFYGAYVKSKNDIFDDNSAVFMEFSNLRNKFHFNYILPFSRNSALIESTYFSSKKEYNMLNEDYINEYMKLNYRNEKYEIEKVEFGSIPMDTSINSLADSYITKIGSYSGATRASTGYTFINIQKQTDRLANLLPNLKSSRNKKYFHSLVLRNMDNIFLKILSRNPSYMKKALMCLFRTKSHNSQIRFLSDTPSFIDIIKIIIYLPKVKFLYYSLKRKDKNDKYSR